MSDRYEYPNELMWYVAHTYSGYEKKVKTNLDNSIKNLHIEDQIVEVLVPMEDVEEVKDGKLRNVQKKLFPGYVLVHMVMNDETWFVVRNTRGVTGFVGPESNPVPLTPAEMQRFGISPDAAAEGETEENHKPARRVLVDIEEGDAVQVIAGAWQGKSGIVRSINEESSTVTVSLDAFHRDTPVDLSYFEIKKA